MRKTFIRFICLLCLILLCASPAYAKTTVSNPRLTQTKVTVKAGKKTKVYVKGSWVKRIKLDNSNKKAVRVTLKNRRLTIQGKRKGTATIKATVLYKKTRNAKTLSKRILTLKVKVKDSVTPVKPLPDPVEPVTKPEKPAPSLTSVFKKQTANTSINLFKEACLANISAGKNTLISPESILQAMLMTSCGTAGNTRSEMTAALTGGIELDSYLSEYKKFSDSLSQSANVSFHQANSVWVRNDENLIRLRSDYENKLKDVFNAQIYLEPFNTATVGKINNWVYNKTDKMIDQVIDRLEADDVMCLINALAFDGRWAEPYEKNQILTNQKFTNANGVTEKASMLSDSASSYLKDDNALGFARYYEGGKYAFVAILPKKGMSLETYVKGMTGEGFVQMFKNPVKGPALTRLPKFTYDDKMSLVEPLKRMGIRDAFIPGVADFSAMATLQDGYDLSIGDVIHKTHIELDENGTKAAAVTAVINKATSIAPGEVRPVEIYLDRPFVYAIVDTASGLPVFVGAVNTLQE